MEVMEERLATYASFDAGSIAFRARVGRERVDFYTGATGNHFYRALASVELLASEAFDGLKVGRLALHGWQVRELKNRLIALNRRRTRRGHPSALAG